VTGSESPLTYRDAGVDVDAADRFVAAIAPLVRATHTEGVVGHPSRFAGLIRADVGGMGDPLIAATCDGVGTKVLLARSEGDFEALGRDLVAMNVNDLLPVGARPILFLDYLAVGRLDSERLVQVVRGAAAACREAGCALLGGETAEMPDLYRPGEFDLAGFAVGVVDGERLPDPASAGPGDAVVALSSTGVHANGLSLARRALFERAGFELDDVIPVLDATLGATLLTPTAIYVDDALGLMDAVAVKAAAHVTGGGLLGRAGAMLSGGLTVRIDPDTYARPPIFDLIASAGDVGDDEMAATFNMGLGFLGVVSAGDAAAAEEMGWLHVGEVVTGEPRVDLGYARR
jgi:phosphoribosylformylglycinamidine cyclo-ligase